MGRIFSSVLLNVETAEIWVLQANPLTRRSISATRYHFVDWMFGELNLPTGVQWSVGERQDEVHFSPSRGLCLFSLQLGLACLIYGCHNTGNYVHGCVFL